MPCSRAVVNCRDVQEAGRGGCGGLELGLAWPGGNRNAAGVGEGFGRAAASSSAARQVA